MRIARTERVQAAGKQAFSTLLQEGTEALGALHALEEQHGFWNVPRGRLSQLTQEHDHRRAAVMQAFSEYIRAITLIGPDAWPELDREHRHRIEAMTGRSYPDPAEV